MKPLFTIVEHSKEKRHKCTVALLKGREGLDFVRAEDVEAIDWGDSLLLYAGAEQALSPSDAGRRLILVDASWRWAERVVKRIPAPRRSLPGFTTAYPRGSKLFRDPPGGLSSAEALFVASLVFGVRDTTLLDAYRWKDEFIETNRAEIERLIADAG